MHDILLVDDQPVNLDFLRTVLQNRGYHLHEAADGEQALEIALRVHPRLVITDIVMPRLDGYTLARRLAEHRELANTLVIVYTAAYQECEARALLPHCGIWRFLTKPCEPEFLLDVVEQALHETRPRELPAAGAEVAEVQLGVVNDKLHQKLAELERLHAELERRVEDRTHELQVEVQRRQRAQEALKAANLRLSDDAMSDCLTGLYNRRFLDQALQRELAHALRHNQPFSLMLIDVDHFKHCNDSFGHAAGDMLLQAVANILRHAFRAEDTVCRYGGDEFVVLMPGTGPLAAHEGANRLRTSLQALQLEHDGAALPQVTLSIGVTSLTPARRTLRAMLRAADRALYRAKQAGRDQAQLSSDYVGLDAPPVETAPDPASAT